MTPEEAVAEYLDVNPKSNGESTMRSHESRLGIFVDWCDDNEIEYMNDLSKEDLEAYREKREKKVKPRTLETQFQTLSVFVRYCESQGYVKPALSVEVPEIEVAEEDKSRDRYMTRERAKEVVSHLSRFNYASQDHALWLLLTDTGIRTCTLRSLDIDDFVELEDGTGYLNLEHRPKTGTRLKNKTASERQIPISSSTCEVLSDYIEHRRPDTIDRYGREPLIATEQGRISASAVRTRINKWSAPCLIGDCPHGRNPDTCRPATVAGDMNCPSKRSPHDLRKGYITYMRQNGWDGPTLSDNVDASADVIDRHYDKTDKEKKRKLHATILTEVVDDFE
ncbi:hypothetical protein B1756_17010 [Natrarchaeobaculum aegyptiacum]|uniref:Integrase n=1 Tax=Natrarchaeobaculum aegyptiacum TaxID=745377 RepID=A0A2Z2HXE0_9EURY|nr:hypothetical protein B1756_17010 [Natrarchaeobaculum aegyptiacum]